MLGFFLLVENVVHLNCNIFSKFGKLQLALNDFDLIPHRIQDFKLGPLCKT